MVLSQVTPVGSDISVISAPFPFSPARTAAGPALPDAAFVKEGANLVPQTCLYQLLDGNSFGLWVGFYLFEMGNSMPLSFHISPYQILQYRRQR